MVLEHAVWCQSVLGIQAVKRAAQPWQQTRRVQHGLGLIDARYAAGNTHLIPCDAHALAATARRGFEHDRVAGMGWASEVGGAAT